MFIPAAAGTLAVTPNNVSGVVQPGNNTVIGQFNISARNASINVTDIVTTGTSLQATYTPSSFVLTASCSTNTSCPVSYQPVNLSISVPTGFSPGTYPGTASFVFADHPTVNRDFTVTVPVEHSWQPENLSVQDNVSVGGRGTVANLSIENRGNVREQIQVNVTGNISQVLGTVPNVTAYPGMSNPVTVPYQLPKDTPFGWYNGTLRFSTGEQTRSVTIETQVLDRIPPSIDDARFPGFMATQSASFNVLARDNLGVASVSATLFRPVSTSGNNTTRRNVSVTTLEFRDMANKDVWAAEFQTDEISQFYANLTVVDQAGNAVTRTVPFTVSGLNTTHVLDANFNVTSTIPGVKVNHSILRIDTETPVTLRLTQLRNTENASSLWVGVRQSGEPVDEKFEGEGDSIRISSTGTYQLVVEGLTAQQYYGKVVVDPPTPHLDNVENITFSGEIVSNVYPRPRTILVGGARINVSIANNSLGVGQHVRIEGVAPAEQCRGYRTWNCLRGLDLGGVEQVKARNAHLEYWMQRWKAIAALSLVFAVAYWRKENIRGRVPYHRKPLKENVEIDGGDFS